MTSSLVDGHHVVDIMHFALGRLTKDWRPARGAG
jgi:hypothetical protein